MSRTFDTLIIGAGITGCCTAYTLAQRGVKVAILERENIGSGSTGRSSAIIRQHYSNELTARMALHGLRAFENLEEELGDGCGFTRTGFVGIVAAKDEAGLKANVALQRSVGIRTELLSPDALGEIMPSLEITDVVAAVYEPDSGYADPHMVVNAYANAARRLGAKIFLNTTVTGVRLAGDHIVGLDTSDGPFDAPVAVNCAGPWGARVARMVGVDLPIDACRAQIALLRAPPGQERHPVVIDFIHASYFRPETGGLTLAGLIDPSEAEDVVDPDDYNDLQDADFVIDLGERLILRCPAMELSRCEGGYAAPYAVTPDWHPIVDELPPGSGFYVCAGFSGHGFKLGPPVGVMVADMLTGRSDPQFDPHVFRFGRFAERDLVRGQYEYSITG